jgi:hypothetical protein
MRILSFILAFGFVCAAPDFHATADSSLPGAGTFTFSGSQLGHVTTTAHLTLSPRGRQLPASAPDSTSHIARG